jgi:hypothetical protein
MREIVLDTETTGIPRNAGGTDHISNLQPLTAHVTAGKAQGCQAGQLAQECALDLLQWCR